MSKLDPRIEAVRAKFDLSQDDFWQIPQNKQWVCKHAALEVVATKANVEWSAPQIIQADTANGIAVLSVTGKMGDRSEWATGEASPKNNKNSYPWAMAEKRAKDRVVLKLVGIHGLVYSEDEAYDFKSAPAPRVDNDHKPASKNIESRALYSALKASLRENKTRADLKAWWTDSECVTKRKGLPPDWQKNLHQEMVDHGLSLPEDERKVA